MGKRHAAGQQQEAAQQQQIDDLQAQQAAAQPASGGGISSDTVQRLQELGKLHEQGILTDDEFAQQKQRLLAG
jgi:hypothetical protein